MRRSEYMLNFDQENYLLDQVAEIMATEEPTDLHRMVHEVVAATIPAYNHEVIAEWLSCEGVPDPINIEWADDDYLYSIKGMSIIQRMALGLEVAYFNFLHLFEGLDDENLEQYREAVNAELAERADYRKRQNDEQEKQDA